MADRNQKVYDRVRQELTKNSQLGSRELYGLAQDIDRSIGQDSLQQFHARYVLPFKREQSRRRKDGAAAAAPKRGRRPKAKVEEPVARAATPAVRRGRRPRRNDGSERDRVRGVLLEFARAFADAESRTQIVQVLSKIDQYVDRITKPAA
jgi:hypothetical protein